MKVKTSITLSEDVVEAIDSLVDEAGNRWELIETVIRGYLAQVKRDEQNRRDLKIINRRAARLNHEAEGVLAYQGEW